MRVLNLSSICLAVMLAGTACSKGPDPTEKTNAALKNAHLDDVKLNWDSDAHVGHLRGAVDQPTDRQRAEEVASAAVGTTGKLLNEVTIKGVNDTNADDLDGQIRSHLKDMIDKDPELHDRRVKFEVNNGVVTVKGSVKTAAEKNKVTDIVRLAPGVKDYANALEIK